MAELDLEPKADGTQPKQAPRKSGMQMMRDRRASQAVRNQKAAAAAETPQQHIANAKKMIAGGQWRQAREALDAASSLSTKVSGRHPGQRVGGAPTAAEIQTLLAKVRAGEAKAKSEEGLVAALANARAALEKESLAVAEVELDKARGMSSPGVGLQVRRS